VSLTVRSLETQNLELIWSLQFPVLSWPPKSLSLCFSLLGSISPVLALLFLTEAIGRVSRQGVGREGILDLLRFC
jgi:hypothetical protein